MATLVHDENGNSMYWQGILFDITKERESQQTILASEERFRRIFHSTPIATCVVTVDEGRFIDANQAFQNLVGITLEDLIGHTSQEFGLQSTQAQNDFITKLKEQGTERIGSSLSKCPGWTRIRWDSELIELEVEPACSPCSMM
jgi:PAS domain S-box-containing protein